MKFFRQNYLAYPIQRYAPTGYRERTEMKVLGNVEAMLLSSCKQISGSRVSKSDAKIILHKNKWYTYKLHIVQHLPTFLLFRFRKTDILWNFLKRLHSTLFIKTDLKLCDCKDIFRR